MENKETVNRVVAHHQDGRIVKGTTQDFMPARPMFHMIPSPGGAAQQVFTKQLKALFFVKELNGNGSRRDLPGFVSAPAETTQGKKIAVRFKDGELLCGYTLSWTPDRDGFFVTPADAGSNNLRVYVITAATVEIKAGPQAEALAQKVIDGQQKSA